MKQLKDSKELRHDRRASGQHAVRARTGLNAGSGLSMRRATRRSGGRAAVGSRGILVGWINFW
jgi:hypothetical protein